MACWFPLYVLQIQNHFPRFPLEVKEFAAKAKNKKLQPADWEGSTFTISNLGMFGMDEFTAIINPPDACILAISSIQQIPVVKNGAIVPGNVMKLTMTCDHRVVDGATGAAFLANAKRAPGRAPSNACLITVQDNIFTNYLKSYCSCD